MRLDATDLDACLASLNTADGPYDLETLTRHAVRCALLRRAPVRGYAPGAIFDVGERIWYEGQIVEVMTVEESGNPRQGRFVVLGLQGTDKVVHRVVAEIAGAPAVGDSPDVSEDEVARAAEAHQAEVRQRLLTDPRLASLIEPQSFGVAGSSTAGERADRCCPSALLAADVLQDAAKPDPQAGAVYHRMRTLWSSIRDSGRTMNASTTWHQLLVPILHDLGWLDVPLSEGYGYALHFDPQSRPAVLAHLREGAGSSEPPPVLIIPVGWGQPLTGSTEPSDRSSVVMQMVGRLMTGAASWAILTNGRRWRLYCAATEDPDVGSTAAEFYEIDLGDIIDRDRAFDDLGEQTRERLLQWWTVFRAESFAADATGCTSIIDLKAASANLAAAAVRALRQEMLEWMVPEVAGGFVAYRRHQRGVETESEDALPGIVRASIGLVTRLLFVLYAEQHRLLPLDHPDYRGISLTTLLRLALESASDARPLSVTTVATPYYDRLLALFRHLEHGAPAMELPSTGGGLFSPLDQDYAFLEGHRLSDRTVARVLAGIGRAVGDAIEGGALTWRHLSAVGEGIVENLLWVVEPSAGQAVLMNDQGELHGASSVPVPDFVGVSAMERAFRGILAERRRRFDRAMARVVALRRASEAAGSPPAGADKTVRPASEEAVEIEAALASAEADAYAALMDIKVLDPAMGTGVFLVGAVDLLVDGLMSGVATYHLAHPWVPWRWNPILRRIDETRQALRQRAARQGVEPDQGLLSDELILARLVIETMLFGIDLNPTAVALSRANLAIRGFVPGGHFPMLEAHLRQGNSLLGGRLRDLEAMEVSAPLSGLVAAAATARLGTEADASREQKLGPYVALLDLWASRDLGNEEADGLLQRLSSRALSLQDFPEGLNAGDAAILARARELRAEHQFVHWDIAFPEVFLRPARTAAMEPGFDVIVGSPPAVVNGPLAGGGEMAFGTLAKRLVRRPGGRVALVMTPSAEALSTKAPGAR